MKNLCFITLLSMKILHAKLICNFDNVTLPLTYKASNHVAESREHQHVLIDWITGCDVAKSTFSLNLEKLYTNWQHHMKRLEITTHL